MNTFIGDMHSGSGQISETSKAAAGTIGNDDGDILRLTVVYHV